MRRAQSHRFGRMRPASECQTYDAEILQTPSARDFPISGFRIPRWAAQNELLLSTMHRRTQELATPPSGQRGAPTIWLALEFLCRPVFCLGVNHCAHGRLGTICTATVRIANDLDRQ